MSQLTFEPSTHLYRVGTETIPSVTQILCDLKISRDYSGIDSFYRDRGIAVHKAIELFLKGRLDESSLDPVCVPYFKAFRDFIRDRELGRFQSEVPLYSESLGFAGTPDLIEHVNDSSCVIYDIKCTESVDRATELQLCAYQLLIEQNMQKKVTGKFPLQLKGDGTFNVITKYSSADPKIWHSVIELYRWKRGK